MYINEYGNPENQKLILLAPMMISGENIYELVSPHLKGEYFIIAPDQGGHCGYSVRPSVRGKGYAKEMLRQNILNAKVLGIDKMLVTCDSDNYASEKTILANGGVFEKYIDVDETQIKRYWISVI